MAKDIEQVKQELVALYQVEQTAATSHKQNDRASLLTEAIVHIQDSSTKSELLASFSDQAKVMLAPVEQLPQLVDFLVGNFSKADLENFGIFINRVPNNNWQPEDNAVFINSGSNRLIGSLHKPIEAVFMGEWTVNVREASIFALKGTNVNLQDDLAKVKLFSKESSAIRTYDVYYQRMKTFISVESYDTFSQILQQQGKEALLGLSNIQTNGLNEIYLTYLTGSPIILDGDRCVAENSEFAWIQNRYDETFSLFKKRSAVEVAQELMSQHKGHILDDCIMDLKASVTRDWFQDLPGHKLPFGKNEEGVEIALTFDPNLQGFWMDNLNPKLNNFFPLSDSLNLETQISLMKQTVALTDISRDMGIEHKWGLRR